MSAVEAARMGDQIGHTSALAGLLMGALAAVAVAVAVVAVVGTGGVAAVAVGAGIAAAGAAGGLAGAHIGAAIPTSPTGTIITGSLNVFIEGLAAARAVLDMAACSGVILTHGTPNIAQGSSSVFINGMPAARKNDKLVCGAYISKVCKTVFIGGETQTLLEIDEDVPGWLNTTLHVVMWAGIAISTGGVGLAVGWGTAIGGLAGGFLGSMGLGRVGGKVGREVGEHFGNGELGARIGEVAGGTLGGFGGGMAGARAGGLVGRRSPGAPIEEAPPAGGSSEELNAQRLRELGTDPRTGQYRQGEADAAARLEEKVGPVKRDPSGDGDWVDPSGKTYDAVGPVPDSKYFNEQAFNSQIDRHLLKQNLDNVVVDMSNLTPAQQNAVAEHIAGLPADQRSRIIVLGRD